MNSQHQWLQQQGSAVPRSNTGYNDNDPNERVPRMPNLGGYSMAAIGRHDSDFSNFSTSSTGTNNSLDSPTTPSYLASSSPTEYDSYDQYQNDPYQTPLSIEYDPQEYILSSSARNQVADSKSTPRSLGWTLTSQWIALYKFVVKNDGKDCYFELKPGFNPSTQSPQRVHLDQDEPSGKPKGSHQHRCMYPGGCTGKQSLFGRSADLERHYQNVHADPDQKKTFYCDYPKCERHTRPFTRKDHERDHFKDFHQEDLGCARGKEGKGTKGKDGKEKMKGDWEREQAKWLADRKVVKGWWRCKVCLERVVVKKDWWTCKGCETDCEPERRQRRERMKGSANFEMEIEEEDEEMQFDEPAKEETHYTMSAALTITGATCCRACNGTAFVDFGMGYGWEPCRDCQPPPPPAQTFFTDNSYSNSDGYGSWQR